MVVNKTHPPLPLSAASKPGDQVKRSIDTVLDTIPQEGYD